MNYTKSLPVGYVKTFYRMKRMKYLFVSILMLSALNMSAHTISRSEEDELRKAIGIDYSMPDFNTSRINGKVIGKNAGIVGRSK